MFTREDEAAAAPPVPAAAAAPTPTAPPPEPAPEAGTPPSSRGWTVFMEPATAAGVAAAAGVSSAPTPAATPVEPTPGVPVANEGEPGSASGATGPRRGWTMFMEAPIDDAGRRSFGPTTPEPAAAPVPEAPAAPAEEPSSDNRGWTVFGAPAPGAPAGVDALPVTPPAVPLPPPPQEHGSDAQPRGAHDASVAPTASGSVTATAEPDPAPGRAKTVVATGVAAVQGSVGGVTGRTVFPAPGAPGGEMPDTQYFRRGDIPPERPTARSTAVDVVPPARAHDDRNAGAGAIVAPGREAPIARSSGRRVVPIVVVGLVAAGLIVAAAMYFT